MSDHVKAPQLMDVARECKRLIDRVDSTDPGMLDDGNVIDFLADNVTPAVSLIDLRCALVVSGHGQRFPKATRVRS